MNGLKLRGGQVAALLCVLLLTISACASNAGGSSSPTGASPTAGSQSAAGPAMSARTSSSTAPSTSGADTSSAPTSSGSADPASLLPAAIRQAGLLKVATSSSWPPFAYQDKDGKSVGLDIDLVTAIAASLGLKAQFDDIEFTSLVPGVSTGRYDVGVDEMADNAARRDQVQFVDYYRAGLGLLVKKGSTRMTPADMCGHSLAVTQGSSQQGTAEGISKKCETDGKKPINFVVLQDTGQTILAVSAGRAEGFLTDNVVGKYLTTTSNTDLQVVNGLVPGADSLSGIMIGKDNHELAAAVAGAFKALMKNGTYAKIMNKYGAGQNMVDEVMLNSKPVS